METGWFVQVALIVGLLVSMYFCLKGLAFWLKFLISLWSFKFDYSSLGKAVQYISVPILFFLFCVNSGLLEPA